MEWHETEVLVRAAWLYYVDQRTQDEVASQLGISRASAGRLLERARRQGIVTFAIDSEYLPVFELGRHLKERFELDDVLVVPALKGVDDDPAATTTRLARGCAQYLQSRLAAGSTLGIGWGAAVNATLQQLPSEVMNRVSAVSLIGGADAFLGPLRSVRGPRAEGVRDAIIPAPIVVSSEGLASALLAEDGVREILEMSRSADVAVIGIGATDATATLSRFGYATSEELAEYTERGAVGDVIGLFYDANGEVIDLPIHRRRIGVGIEELHSIPCVVGAAGGMEKVAAIRGALAGGHIDVLVTTEAVARALLDEE